MTSSTQLSLIELSLLEALRDTPDPDPRRPGLASRDIAALAPESRSQARGEWGLAQLRRLERAGLARRTDTGRPARFRPTPQGHALLDESADRLPRFAPIQIGRPLTSRAPLDILAARLGLPTPPDPHVTLAYSRTPVDWARDAFTPCPTPISIVPHAPRIAVFGTPDTPLLVLAFDSDAFVQRHAALWDAGASWDFRTYQPHITLGRAPSLPVEPGPVELDAPLTFGPEYRRPARA